MRPGHDDAQALERMRRAGVKRELILQVAAARGFRPGPRPSPQPEPGSDPLLCRRLVGEWKQIRRRA